MTQIAIVLSDTNFILLSFLPCGKSVDNLGSLHIFQHNLEFPMPFALKSNQTVLFIGDSITDCGRRGDHMPLGGGYVTQTRDLIAANILH